MNSLWYTLLKKLINLGHQKMCTALLKKTKKSLKANIFVCFDFKNKTKKWNLILL
jgi:hypothetical protein